MTFFIWLVSCVVFACGLTTAVFRRELIAMLLGLELMITGVNISLVYHARLFADAEALAGVLLIIAVAAAEAVVGLSLVLRVARAGRAPDASALQALRG